MSDCKNPCNKYKEVIDKLEAENIYLKKILLSKLLAKDANGLTAKLESLLSPPQ